MDSDVSRCKIARKTDTADIWKYVKSRGERYAFETVQQDVASDKKLNFNELSKKVEAFAKILRKLNLPSGIGICSENNLDYLWILLGALNAGVRCTLLSPKYTARELRHFLELAKPDVILCSELVNDKTYENGESFGSVCLEYEFIKKIYAWGLTTDKNSRHESMASLLFGETNLPRASCKENLSEEGESHTFDQGTREALILASSGSTGLPKGVVVTHRAIVETLKLSSVFARSGATALGLMPFFHSYGLILSLMCLCEGSRLVIVPKLVGSKYLSNIIAEHQINELYIIPSLLVTIGKCSTFTKEKLSSVKHVWTSAGRVSGHAQERALKLMPDDSVLHHCYGMTETTFVTITGSCEKLESPGKLVPNIECKIMSGDKVCGPNEAGELYFRGPTVMRGYLNNEKATKESLQDDGWLRSGDLGYRDSEGFFFIVDRIKEMIKYQGNQVSPVEIEGIILELPDILEAAVVGLPSEDFGELPAAGIVVKKNAKLTEEEVKEHVASQLSTYKRLRGGVFFFDRIPKTGSGKVQRKEVLKRIINVVCCYHRLRNNECSL